MRLWELLEVVCWNWAYLNKIRGKNDGEEVKIFVHNKENWTVKFGDLDAFFSFGIVF